MKWGGSNGKNMMSGLGMSLSVALFARTQFMTNYKAYCDSDDKEGGTANEDPCEKYNSFMHRLNWATRKDKCVAEEGCKFIGWRTMGSCEPDKNVIRSLQKLNNDEKVGAKVIDKPPVPSDQQVNLSLREKFTKASSDSLVDSLLASMEAMTPSITASAAGAVNQGVTRSPQLTTALARVFAASLQAPKVEENLRWQWVWLINSQMMYDNAYYQAKYQRDHWLTSSDGFNYSSHYLLNFADWYLLHPETQTDIIIPKLEATFKDKDAVIKPAVKAINETLVSKETEVIKATLSVLHELNTLYLRKR
jgi:hypothetical protein